MWGLRFPFSTKCCWCCDGNNTEQFQIVTVENWLFILLRINVLLFLQETEAGEWCGGVCSEADERGRPGVRYSDSMSNNEAIDQIHGRRKQENTNYSFLVICSGWRIYCWGFRWGCQERRHIIPLRSFCGTQGGTAPPGACTLLWPPSTVSLLTTCSWLNTCLTNTPGCPFPTGWEESVKMGIG